MIDRERKKKKGRTLYCCNYTFLLCMICIDAWPIAKEKRKMALSLTLVTTLFICTWPHSEICVVCVFLAIHSLSSTFVCSYTENKRMIRSSKRYSYDQISSSRHFPHSFLRIFSFDMFRLSFRPILVSSPCRIFETRICPCSIGIWSRNLKNKLQPATLFSTFLDTEIKLKKKKLKIVFFKDMKYKTWLRTTYENLIFLCQKLRTLKE